MKKFKNFYFYCQFPKDYILAFFFHNFLKEYFKNSTFHLVLTKDDYSKDYNWKFFINKFHNVLYVKKSNIGSLRNRINLRGILFFILKGYFRSYLTNKQLKSIKVPDNTLLITFGGFSLEKSLFLNLSNLKKNIKSFLIADDLDDVKLSEFKYAIKESLYYNLYQYFYSKKYVDIFWFRSSISTSQREYRFRDQPTDYFFKGEYLFRNKSLNNKQLYWPIFFHKNTNNKKQEIAIIGGMYHWEKLINLKFFYNTYNNIINLIRDNSVDCKLTYINHPSTEGEKDIEINKLTLKNFKIIKNLSCENYAYNCKNNLTFFTIFSTAVYTLNQMGSPAFTVYKLFNSGEMDKKFINRLNYRWKIDKKFGKFHLNNQREIIDVISNLSIKKSNTINNYIIKDYKKKLDFLL